MTLEETIVSPTATARGTARAHARRLRLRRLTVVLTAAVGTTAAACGADEPTPTRSSSTTTTEARPFPSPEASETSAPPPTPTPPPSPVLWSTTFEDEDWTEEAGVVVRSRDDTSLVGDGPDGRRDVLAVSFGRDGSRWGMDFRHSLEETGVGPLEEVYFSYDVYLEPGFEFIGDGKLGGLAGISAGVDPLETSAGGEYDERSFSVRAMWREDRSVVMYLYARRGAGRDIDDRANYGYGITEPFTAADGSTAGVLEAGRWFRIEHHVRMNTPGRADGLYEMRIDGHLGLSVADIEYRTADHPDLRINQLFSSWFFGGDESQFPTHVNVAYTDDWVLATEPGARPDTP